MKVSVTEMKRIDGSVFVVTNGKTTAIYDQRGRIFQPSLERAMSKMRRQGFELADIQIYEY